MLIKRYNLPDLFTGFQDIRHRATLIEKITQGTPSPTFFELDIKNVIRHTKRVSGNHIDYGTLNEEQQDDFAKIMDHSFRLNLVHGDLNRKNIFISNQGKLVISDWEPCLVQMVKGKKSLMGTPPWIDADDLKRKELTIKTDLLCFYKIITNCSKDFFSSIEWKNLQKSILGSRIPYYSLLKHIRDSKKH